MTQRWERDELPRYAQFDNDTVFQGAHQFADTIGRVSRLCLQLGVIPVFAPPREPGFQNPIEGFNALWQAKVWQRHRVSHLQGLQQLSARYVAAHRAKTRERQANAPARRAWPARFSLDLQREPQGTMIFIRRADEQAHVLVLGRTFDLPSAYAEQLIRCEVDLRRHRLRVYALSRRHSHPQTLIAVFSYRRTAKPFKGAK